VGFLIRLGGENHSVVKDNRTQDRHDHPVAPVYVGRDACFYCA
jgi:hypothetical protein